MGNTHALIIDDNSLNVDVLVHMLTNESVSSTVIENPSELHHVLPELDRIDVVFLDLEMPNLDGFEVLEILRSDFGLTVPVVAYTVHVSEVNVAHEQGFHSFLGKPLRLDRFPDQLARILNDEPVWDIG